MRKWIVVLVLAWGCSSEVNLTDGTDIGNLTDTAADGPGGPGGPGNGDDDDDATGDPNDPNNPDPNDPNNPDPSDPNNPNNPDPNDPNNPDPNDPANPYDPNDPPDWDLTDNEICEFATHISGYLDPYQTPGNGRVWYCHAAANNNWVFQESDISSCITHLLNHFGDVFPTSGCDS